MNVNLKDFGNQYYKSFSGTDTLAFIMMPGCTPVVIGSLTTISYSMYRNKKPVINIGRTNINGVTRGSRIFAGTMVFTLINQHWLKELQEQIDYLQGFEELKVDELPLFDVMIISANEYGNAVSMYIYGIDFTDEAQTISVEDLFTENTFSFVARDVSNFEKIKYGDKKGPVKRFIEQKKQLFQKFFILKSSNVPLGDLSKLAQGLTLAKIEQSKAMPIIPMLRPLYLNSSKYIIGNDVMEIQQLLKKHFPEININGIFDSEMKSFVMKFQSEMGMNNIDGVVNDKVYNLLLNDNNIEAKYITGIVVNKAGTAAYKYMTASSDIIDTYPYKTIINIDGLDSFMENGKLQKWFKTGNGYVMTEDVFCSKYNANVIEFPIVQYSDSSMYVTLIQQAIQEIYSDYTGFTPGLFDDITLEFVKKIQTENGFYPDGIVTNQIWIILQSLSENITQSSSDDNFNITFTKVPDNYAVHASNIISEVDSFIATVSCNNNIRVKASVISHYPDNAYEVFTKTMIVKDPFEIKLSEFQNAFNYNITHGCIPDKLEYIIYPYNKEPYKWMYEYIKDI